MAVEKQCTKCLVVKPVDSFHKCVSQKSGLKPRCKFCVSDTAKEERRLGISKDHLRSRKYRENNPDKRKEIVSNYIELIKKRDGISPSLKYQKRMKRATLKPFRWWALQNQYRVIARQKTIETGIKYSIDHIIPLNGKIVSGLHVPWNIQVIPLSENMKKGNDVECR